MGDQEHAGQQSAKHEYAEIIGHARIADNLYESVSICWIEQEILGKTGDRSPARLDPLSGHPLTKKLKRKNRQHMKGLDPFFFSSRSGEDRLAHVIMNGR